MNFKHIFLAIIFLSLAAEYTYAAEVKAKSLTAQEYRDKLTLNDIELNPDWQEWSSFHFRNTIRRMCQLHSQDPWNHLYILLHGWSKKIDLISPVKTVEWLNEKVADNPTAIRMSNAEEFEATIKRLLPGFLNKTPEGYTVNFSADDWKMACRRKVWNPDKENHQERYYYIADPDSGFIYY